MPRLARGLFQRCSGVHLALSKDDKRNGLCRRGGVTSSPGARYSGMRRWLLLPGAFICLTACGRVPAALATSTGVIPWIDAPPGFATHTPAPVIPPCSIPDLHVTYEGAQGLGGGQLSATIGFVNFSSRPCVLQGAPGLALLDVHGSVIKTSPSGYQITDRSDPVLLGPAGQTRQAYVPFAWPAIDLPAGGVECPSPSAAAIRVTLPGGGLVTVAATQPADRPSPIIIAPCHGEIAVGAFQAVEPSVEPTPTLHRISYQVSLPRSVRPGTNLDYTVRFTNTTAFPFAFEDPCPNYHEDLYLGEGVLGKPLGKHIYALNCHPVKAIAAHASVTFAMVLDVPADATGGHYTLLWAPDEGTDTQDIQRLPIVVGR